MTECSICLEELLDKNIKLDCGHKYHYDCILKINDNSCPLCRRKIVNVDICLGNHKTFFNNNFYKKNGTCIICGYYSYKGYLNSKFTN